MRKVFLGLSGGVDSSVAAYLLKEQGYEVVGVNVVLYDESRNPRTCCSIEALQLAYRVSKKLGIEFKVINYTKEFKRGIVRMFVEEYLKGRTPNVCVFCNRDYKLGAIWELARRNDGLLSTGHYARIGRFMGKKVIMKGLDSRKDQSYFLVYLRKEMVENMLLPVGELTKEEVRRIAREIGLDTAERRDSMDICFVDDDYREFLVSKGGYSPKEGEIVDVQGRVLGKHKGYAFYTIGQRKGLGIALGRKAYVVDIVPEENKVIVGFREDVLRRFIKVVKLNMFVVPSEKFVARVKIRYRHEPAEALVRIKGNEAEVEFHEPQFAPTPGQIAAFYIGDYLIGGGVIQKTS